MPTAVFLVHFVLLIMSVQKNIHAFGCCKFDIHEPILTTFGRNVTEEVHSQKMLFSYLI